MLAARRSMAAGTGASGSVRVGVLPFEPERLKKKALIIRRDMRGVQKITVGRSYGYGRGVRGSNSVAEIAKSRQTMGASEPPMRVEPDALGAFDGLAAMDAGQHESNFNPIASRRDSGLLPQG